MTFDDFTAQVIGVALAETAKNIAKGTVNKIYTDFNLIFRPEIISLQLNEHTEAEEITNRLEENPKILEAIQQKLSASPQLAEEVGNFIRQNDNLRRDHDIRKFQELNKFISEQFLKAFLEGLNHNQRCSSNQLQTIEDFVIRAEMVENQFLNQIINESCRNLVISIGNLTDFLQNNLFYVENSHPRFQILSINNSAPQNEKDKIVKKISELTGNVFLEYSKCRKLVREVLFI